MLTHARYKCNTIQLCPLKGIITAQTACQTPKNSCQWPYSEIEVRNKNHYLYHISFKYTYYISLMRRGSLQVRQRSYYWSIWWVWIDGKTARHYGSELSLQLLPFRGCWWTRTQEFLRMEPFQNSSCGICHPYVVQPQQPLQLFLSWEIKFQRNERALVFQLS